MRFMHARQRVARVHLRMPKLVSVECLGTEQGLQDRFASRPHERIPFYRRMYENCTTVTSNLEIVHLYPSSSKSEFDLSFLENIREVINTQCS